MADDYVNMHKRIAMGQPNAETHLKKGGGVKRYAKGGAVSESAAPNLPARGGVLPPNMTSGKQKIATMKRGGAPKPKPTLMIAIGIPKRAAGRGR